MALTVTIDGKKWKEYKIAETLSEKSKIKKYLNERGIKFTERTKSISLTAMPSTRKTCME
jgi:hypothetical protein